MDEVTAKRLENYRERFVELHDRMDGPGMSDLAADLLERLDEAWSGVGPIQSGDRIIEVSAYSESTRLLMLESRVDLLEQVVSKPRFAFWRR